MPRACRRPRPAGAHPPGPAPHLVPGRGPQPWPPTYDVQLLPPGARLRPTPMLAPPMPGSHSLARLNLQVLRERLPPRVLRPPISTLLHEGAPARAARARERSLARPSSASASSAALARADSSARTSPALWPASSACSPPPSARPTPASARPTPASATSSPRPRTRRTLPPRLPCPCSGLPQPR